MSDAHRQNEVPPEKTQELSPDFSLRTEPGDGNNDPAHPLSADQLGIDEFLVDRLSPKPPGKYKFRRSIARGGMKMVLEVRDIDSMRNVAMAVLPDAQKRPPADVLRFVREARLTASLEHPNIVPVHDIGIDSNGSPYFTMKLLRGQTLAALLAKLADGDETARKQYTLPRLLKIFLKICSGIEFAHSRRVLHLDLKPENIQLGDFGEVLIIDWGLARTMDREEQEFLSLSKEKIEASTLPDVTMDGMMKGTPGYMAPEQAEGLNSRKDTRTDIYALGALLYAMLTWCTPLEKKNIQEMVEDTRKGRILPPLLRTPDREIPPALDAVVRKAMSLSPEDRYSSVTELRDEVKNFIGGYATQAEKASVVRKSVLMLKRHAILSVSLFLFLLLLTIGTILAVQEQKRRKEPWLPLTSGNPAELLMPGPQAPRFLSPDMRPAPAWNLSESGLEMVPGESMILKENLIRDWIMEFAFRTPSAEDMMEIRLGENLLIRLGADAGTRDLICRIRPDGGEEILAGNLASPPDRKQIRRVTLRRLNGTLTLNSGSRKPRKTTVAGFLPPASEAENVLSIRSPSAEALLVSLKISTRKTAERTTPLIAAETLLEVHLYEPALRKYLWISDNYPAADFCDTALLSAYQLAALFLPDIRDRAEHLAEIKKKIAGRKNFAFPDQIRETDAARLWRDGEITTALRIIAGILDKNPDSDILIRLLSFSRREIPKNDLPLFFQLLRQTRNLSSLDLSGLGLHSVEGLRGLKLNCLDCSGNSIEDLSGLENMPLKLLVTDRGIFRTPDEIRDAVAASSAR